MIFFRFKYFNYVLQRDLTAHVITEDKASAILKLVNTRSVGFIHSIEVIE